MPITDLLAWANDVEIVRLPAITGDVAALQGLQTSMDDDLRALSLELTDRVAEHHARITSNTNLLDTTSDNAFQALTKIYGAEFAAKSYTDARHQALLNYIDARIDNAVVTLTGDVTTKVDTAIGGVMPSVNSTVNQTLAEAALLRDSTLAEYQYFRDVSDEITDFLIPTVDQLTILAETKASALEGRLNVAMANFQYAGILEEIDAVTGLAMSTVVARLDDVESEATIIQQAYADMSGALSSSIVMRTKAGTDGAELELVSALDPDGEFTSIGRFTADTILLEGSVFSSLMYIDEALILDAQTAGFMIGKSNAYDRNTDGGYMGRTEEPDGSTGFGFSFSMFSPMGVAQHLEITKQNGLRLTNANHYKNFEVTPTPTQIVTSQTVAIPPTAVSLSVVLQAGGGGGNAGASGSQTGGVGEDTTAVLKQNGTSIATWTATGGPGGPGQSFTGNFGTKGKNSPWGTGGAGGGYYANGSDGQGYGAGGGGGYSDNGGGGRGGEAGQHLTIEDYALTGLTGLTLEITLGAGGLGRPAPNGLNRNGGNGSPGRVDVAFTDSKPLPADVLPLNPTAFGTMSNRGPFPDLGSGFWSIHTTGGSTSNIELGTISIDDSGTPSSFKSGDNVAFISSKTPTVVSTSNTERTLSYKFYKMGT